MPHARPTTDPRDRGDFGSVGDGLPEMLTVREIARRCRVQESTVYFWIQSGHLKARRFGTRRCYRVPRPLFLAFLEESTEF